MPLSSLRSVHKRLLYHDVVDSIRTAIFEGDLELGQRLVETEIGDQLGVSRGPVREALRLLAAEGLVVINVHRGTFVVKPTAADVEEIYTLREALEALAIRRVVELATDEEIESLEEVAEQVLAASQQKKLDEVLGLNMELHNGLFHIARHDRLSQIWSSLESQLQLCNTISIAIEGTRQDVSRGSGEHIEIVKAIKKRDAETACQIMSQHIRKEARVIQQAVDSSSRK